MEETAGARNKKISYICKTGNQAAIGLSHCCSKFDRVLNPAKLYRKTEADSGLSIVFEKETFLGKDKRK